MEHNTLHDTFRFWKGILEEKKKRKLKKKKKNLTKQIYLKR